MSFVGIQQFRENLDTLMESKAFKKANDGERIKMGVQLLRGKYGVYGSWLFNSVKKLKVK